MPSSNLNIEPALRSQINQARQAGEALDHTEQRAVKAWYNIASQKVFVEISNGIEIGFPYQILQGLESATPEQLTEVEVTPSGYGLHWESLDVDLSVPQLLAGIFSTQVWMAELGRQGRKAKSAAKEKAAQENGKRGGRPRKTATFFARSDD
jgi:Protein of unknown function (DUF2442)